MLGSLHLATQTAPDWGKAWHHWALFNVQAIEHYAHTDVQKAQTHVALAVQGFFRSVALGQASGEFLSYRATDEGYTSEWKIGGEGMPVQAL